MLAGEGLQTADRKLAILAVVPDCQGDGVPPRAEGVVGRPDNG